MSFTRRILDGARTGLNTVMDRIAADDTPLSHVDEAVFQYELELRKKARRDKGAEPRDNPRAKLASASAAAQAKRARMAEKRASRIHARRAKRAAEEERVREEQFRRAKEQARRAANSARQTAGAGPRSSSGPRPGSGQQRRAAPGASGDKIAGYYKVLDLPQGAPFEDIKKSYRKLMRKYHPDRHMGNPKKQKAATELSMRVTQAYNELDKYLNKKR